MYIFIYVHFDGNHGIKAMVKIIKPWVLKTYSLARWQNQDQYQTLF